MIENWKFFLKDTILSLKRDILGRFGISGIFRISEERTPTLTFNRVDDSFKKNGLNNEADLLSFKGRKSLVKTLQID